MQLASPNCALAQPKADAPGTANSGMPARASAAASGSETPENHRPPSWLKLPIMALMSMAMRQASNDPSPAEPNELPCGISTQACGAFVPRPVAMEQMASTDTPQISLAQRAL